LTTRAQHPALIFRARSQLCALPLGAVVETMRPLPLQSALDAPAFVAGVARVRGAALPVVDAGALIGAAEPPNFARFVTLRTDGGGVALAVESVLGVQPLASDSFRRLPPLLRAGGEIVAALAALDAELLLVLELARTLTERILRTLPAEARA